MHTLETRNKISNSLKGNVPWNKGLTKNTDSRLRKPTKYSHYIEPYIHACPQCGIEKQYDNVYYYHNVVTNDRQCNKCANRGKGWQSSSDTYIRTSDINKKSRISALNRIRKQVQIVPNYNINSISIIEEYGKKHGYNFQHAENGGEYYIKSLGYFVDAYDKEKNVVLEIDEPYHFNTDGSLKNKDVIRQEEIIKELDCKFIRLKYEK